MRQAPRTLGHRPVPFSGAPDAALLRARTHAWRPIPSRPRRRGGQAAHLRPCEIPPSRLGDPPTSSGCEAGSFAGIARGKTRGPTRGKSGASIGEILGVDPPMPDAPLRRIPLRLGVIDPISTALRGFGFRLIRAIA